MPEAGAKPDVKPDVKRDVKPEDASPSDDAPQPGEDSPRWLAVLKRIGTIRLALAIAFLVTLAVPATREMHVLTFRLLFRIPGPNTYVQGLPEDGHVRVVPSVVFHNEYEEARLRESHRGLEEYFLALTCRRWRAPPVAPPVEKWEGEDDLLLLCALWGTESVTDRDGDFDHGRVLALVKPAQHRFPANGYLWLAEARIRYEQGDRDKAVSALHEAAKRPDGPIVTPASEDRAHEILVKAGLSHLDASRKAVYRRQWLWSVPWGARSCLADDIAEAISEDDKDRILPLLHTVDALRKAGFELTPGVRLLGGTLTASEIGEAAAEKLGRKLPDLGTSRYQARKQALKDATIDYFKLALGETDADYLVMSHFSDPSPAAKEAIEKSRKASVAAYRKVAWRFIWATVSGLAALLALACLVAYGMHEGAYALVPVLRTDSDDWRVLRR
ncbi:MAG: hypothetical protein ACYS9X_29320, partial [Planctomycetota bacterium]